jgi:hypothetical protein
MVGALACKNISKIKQKKRRFEKRFCSGCVLIDNKLITIRDSLDIF